LISWCSLLDLDIETQPQEAANDPEVGSQEDYELDAQHSMVYEAVAVAAWTCISTPLREAVGISV